MFDAIKARFDSDATLRRYGRKLYEGFKEERQNVVRPYTEVNARLGDRLDTFGTDIERWELEFRFHGKDLQTNAADEWTEAMMNAYREARVTSPFFHTAGCNHTGQDGPSFEDGLYEASMTFDLFVQRKQLAPLVRRM